MNASYLVRDVTSIESDDHDALIGLRALACVELPGTPGYLTGEPLAEQGIETNLPNLPDLPKPDLRSRDYGLRLTWPAPNVARITIAPVGSQVLEGDGTWLGIITDPAPEPAVAVVEEHQDEIVAQSSRARVKVRRRPFALSVENAESGKVVLRTAECLRQAAGFPMAPAVVADDRGTSLHLELAPDETILGFGEQFGRLVKNGQLLRLRTTDALGTGTGLAYKPVPVWHSSTGYTALLNTGSVVTADVGHTRPSVLGLSAADDVLDLYVVVGDRPTDRLSSYTLLTGRAQVPPVWTFGYWMGRCRYHSREQMLHVAEQMRHHAVPCDVLHVDPDWLIVDRLNCDFHWNTERFGDRAEFVDALARSGLRLSVWELPYLDPKSPRYSEAEQAGYLVRNTSGEVASVVDTPSPDGRPRALLDFTNTDARAWWQSLHEAFLADGVAVFKTDFGEGLPDDAILADGTPPNHAHNLYPLRYNGAVSDAVGRYTGRNPLVWGRSGWAGSQRYPAQWGGDAESTVAGMQATLRGGLSYALSAPGLWSHDVGGFFGPELTPELYVRWTQFGALSPLMRAHGLRPREPWAFGQHVLTIARDWVRLRYQLLPYLWQSVHNSLRHGWPVLRPLAMHFPDDPIAAGIDGQFLLGEDLLVAPVFDDGPGPSRHRIYVPDGVWTDLLTAERFQGPAFHVRSIPLERMPVLVRAGTILPRVPVDADVRNTDDLLGLPWTLHTYGEVAGECRLVGFDGTTTRAAIAGAVVCVAGSQPVDPDVVRHV